MENTDLEDLCLSRMILHFLLFCYWVLGSFCQHILLLSCADVLHTGAVYTTAKKVTDATEVIAANGFEPAHPEQQGWGFFSYGRVWELCLSSATLAAGAAGPSTVPPHSHTDGWGTGGLGRGAEEFWFGTPWAPRQPGVKEGTQPEPSTMLTRIASFGKEETQEPQLKHCSAVGITQLCIYCVLPLSLTELGQYFTGLGKDLWAGSQNWNAHCLDSLEKYIVLIWLTVLWKSLGWRAHCGEKAKKWEQTGDGN